MKARRARYGLAVVLAALLLAGLGACHDELSPIFYTIEKEQPIADAGLPNEVIVTGLVKLNDIGAPAADYYVAAYGPISYRAAPAGDWAALALPPGAAHCTALEVSGETLYGGFCSSTDASLGVWTVSTASFPDISATDWVRIGNASLQNVDITMIQEANGVVFVSTRDGTNYNLYESGNTTSLINENDPITDIAYNPNANSVAGAYFAISGERIFQIADPTVSPVVTDLGSPTEVGSVNYFGGIYFAPGIGASGTMYVSTGDGRLVSTTDGTTWDPSSVIKVDSAAVEFRDFIQAGTGPTFHLLVGTRMQGYFDLPDGDVGDTPVRQPDFNLAELYNGAVLGFLWDEEHSLLFARTYGAGLWSSSDLGADWSRE